MFVDACCTVVLFQPLANPPPARTVSIEGFPYPPSCHEVRIAVAGRLKILLIGLQLQPQLAMIGGMGDDVCDQAVFAPAKSSDCWVVYLIYIT